MSVRQEAGLRKVSVWSAAPGLVESGPQWQGLMWARLCHALLCMQLILSDLTLRMTTREEGPVVWPPSIWCKPRSSTW